VPCVLVLFGPTGDAVKEMKPQGLLNHYSEISQVLNQIHPI